MILEVGLSIPPFPELCSFLVNRGDCMLIELCNLNVMFYFRSPWVMSLGGCFRGVSNRGKVFLSLEMTLKTLDVVDSAIDPKEFFAKYVKTRTPVLIKGFIRDEGFKASRWVSVPHTSSSPPETHPDVWKRQTWNISLKRPAT